MKKFYFLLIAFCVTNALNAQCVIDTTLLTPGTPGIFPSAQHLPHLVKDSLYDQTVQARIQDTINMTFAGIFSVSIRVDSVRLDSVNGLPNGITWVKNPNVLHGGHYGCVEFTGTASDTAGTYRLSAIGKIWAHLTAPLLGLDKDTFSYGSLNQLPPWRNYYVVVDSAPQPLALTTTVKNLCFGDGLTGRVSVFATGGSTVSPYTYLWNTGSTSYTLANIDTGTYSVTVTSGSETASATVTVVAASSPLIISTTATGSTGADGTATVAVTGGVMPYAIFWNTGDNTDTVIGLAPGTYRVTVRDSFGCLVRDSAVVANLVSGIASVIGETPLLSVFPNPANALLNVVVDSRIETFSVLEIMDMSGRIMYTAPIPVADKLNRVINTTSFSAGIYILQLRSQKQLLRQRFVVGR